MCVKKDFFDTNIQNQSKINTRNFRFKNLFILGSLAASYYLFTKTQMFRNIKEKNQLLKSIKQSEYKIPSNIFMDYKNPTIKDQKSVLRQQNDVFKSSMQNFVFKKLNNKPNRYECVYRPTSIVQGHYSISHGGFTAYIVGLAAKSIIKLQEEQQFDFQNKLLQQEKLGQQIDKKIIKDFFIRYTKPIYVERQYKIIFDFKEDNNINFKIYPYSHKLETESDEKQQIYAFGHLKFEN